MALHAPPTRIRLICHPASRKQMEGYFPSDDMLDAHAIASMKNVAWRPNGHVRVWTSPELRTRETADALGFTADVATELRECAYGSWTGRSLEEISTADPSGLSFWLSDLAATPHQGESLHHLLTRVGAWIERQHQAGPCVVVTHASIIRAAIIHALGSPPEAFQRIEVAPLSLTDLRLSGLRWHVRSMGVPLTGAEGS